MNRRDLLLATPLLAMAGGALGLTPHRRLLLLPEGVQLDKVVPDRVAGWQRAPSDAFILPKSPGSLADRLYSQMVTRLYLAENAPPVMLVIAYGAVQNDLLQLHRPEVCYTAVGFEIQDSHPATLQLAGTSALRVRDLVARTDSRVECITYWTRIGDDLPTDSTEQRWMKLRQQMQGYIADGILVRLSTVGEPSEGHFGALAEFAKAMMLAVQPAYRPALIGREAAAAMA